MSRIRETPAERAEKLARRTGYLAAIRTYRNPDSTSEEKATASRHIDEYFAWVDTLPKIGH